MKYQKVIDQIVNGGMSRIDLLKLQQNAEKKLKQGDADAKYVIDAISISKPVDDYVLFMGFCPGADISRRLDTQWKEEGICRFDFIESTKQLEQFKTICKGDLVILKKREQFGKTMKLFGHGRVKSIAYDQKGLRYLVVDWSKQNLVIEVPLMGCNSTVDIRPIGTVQQEMPNEFYTWIGF